MTRTEFSFSQIFLLIVALNIFKDGLLPFHSLSNNDSLLLCLLSVLLPYVTLSKYVDPIKKLNMLF